MRDIDKWRKFFDSYGIQYQNNRWCKHDSQELRDSVELTVESSDGCGFLSSYYAAVEFDLSGKFIGIGSKI